MKMKNDLADTWPVQYVYLGITALICPPKLKYQCRLDSIEANLEVGHFQQCLDNIEDAKHIQSLR